MKIASGSYTGNGSAGHAITGLGFKPDFLWVQGAAASRPVIVASSTMTAGTAKQILTVAAPATGLISSLDAGGFTLGAGANVNANGETFYWFAVLADGTTAKVVSYTGNGAANHAITGVGFQPDFVMTWSANGTNPGGLKFVGQGTQTMQWASSSFSNGIVSFDADGFTLGTDIDSNANGVTFHAFCLKQVTGAVKVVSYTGDGTDNRNVTGVGFQPDNLILKGSGGSTTIERYKGVVGDKAWSVNGTFAASSNEIQSFISDGFQVGSDTWANASGFVTYYALALKDYAPATTTDLAGTALFTYGANGGLAVTRRLAGSAALAFAAAGGLAVDHAVAGSAGLLFGAAGALDTSTIDDFAGAAGLAYAAAGALDVDRTLAGAAGLAYAAAAALTIDEPSEIVPLSGSAGLAFAAAAALSLPYAHLAGTGGLTFNAYAPTFNPLPVSEGGSGNGEEPGGGLVVDAYPPHWAAIREGDNCILHLPYAGVAGASPVARLMSRTYHSGDSYVDCDWQHYEAQTQTTSSRALGAAKPFVREDTPARKIARSGRRTSAATGKARLVANVTGG